MSNGWIPQGTPPAAPLQCAESFFLVVTVPGPREGCFPRGPSAEHQLHWAEQSQAGLGPAPLAVLAAVLVGSVSGHSDWGRAQCSVVVFMSVLWFPAQPRWAAVQPSQQAKVSLASAGSHHNSHRTCQVPEISCCPFLDVTGDFPLLVVVFALSIVSLSRRELLWTALFCSSEWTSLISHQLSGLGPSIRCGTFERSR